MFYHFVKNILTPRELALLDGKTGKAEFIAGRWAAKEAFSKALGTGIRYSPKELIVHRYQADTGLVAIRLEGAWEAAFKGLKGRDLTVATRIMLDHVLAFSFIPETLFADKEK